MNWSKFRNELIERLDRLEFGHLDVKFCSIDIELKNNLNGVIELHNMEYKDKDALNLTTKDFKN